MQLEKFSSERLLEWYTARTLEKQGYDVRPKSLEELGNIRLAMRDRERQIDVYAKKAGLFQTENLLVECKCRRGRIGAADAENFSTSVVQAKGELRGSVNGLFVSISELTESAREHLTKEGIAIVEGSEKVKAFVGDQAYRKIAEAMLEADEHEEYQGRVLFSPDTLGETLQVRGTSGISLEQVKTEYVPVVFCQAKISCDRSIPSIKNPITYKQEPVFLASFEGNAFSFKDSIDGARAEILAKEKGNLIDASVKESIATPRPDLSDPLMDSMLRTEACRRGTGTILYSEVLGEWTSNDQQELTTRTLARIQELEDAEVDTRKQRDEDHILDFEQRIAEAESLLMEFRGELSGMQDSEETPKQRRRRAFLEGKVRGETHRLETYRSKKAELSERLSRDLENIGKKYAKMRSGAVRQMVVRPEPTETYLDTYTVWLPNFQAMARARLGSDLKEALIPIRWNGMSGVAELGACKTCGTKLSNDNGSICSKCMSLICESHTQECSRCSRLFCIEDVWTCRLCNKRYCEDEKKSLCRTCDVITCPDCSSICTECGYSMCKNHAFSCSKCGRSLCDLHKYSCPVCHNIVCDSELDTCKGCERRVCRDDFVNCPKCGASVCKTCLRKKRKLSAILTGRLSETRCVFCLRAR